MVLWLVSMQSGSCMLKQAQAQVLVMITEVGCACLHGACWLVLACIQCTTACGHCTLLSASPAASQLAALHSRALHHQRCAHQQRDLVLVIDGAVGCGLQRGSSVGLRPPRRVQGGVRASQVTWGRQPIVAKGGDKFDRMLEPSVLDTCH